MIKLNLYNEENEIERTLVRNDLRWGSLKRVLQLQDEISDGDPMESLDVITEVVANVFGVEPDVIEKGCEAQEILGCMTDIAKQAMQLKAGNFRKGTKG